MCLFHEIPYSALCAVGVIFQFILFYFVSHTRFYIYELRCRYSFLLNCFFLIPEFSTEQKSLTVAQTPPQQEQVWHGLPKQRIQRIAWLFLEYWTTLRGKVRDFRASKNPEQKTGQTSINGWRAQNVRGYSKQGPWAMHRTIAVNLWEVWKCTRVEQARPWATDGTIIVSW